MGQCEVKWGSVVKVTPTVLPAMDEDTFGSLLDDLGNGDAELQCNEIFESTIRVTLSIVSLLMKQKIK